jgi:hypothetical protein
LLLPGLTIFELPGELARDLAGLAVISEEEELALR